MKREYASGTGGSCDSVFEPGVSGVVSSVTPPPYALKHVTGVAADRLRVMSSTRRDSAAFTVTVSVLVAIGGLLMLAILALSGAPDDHVRGDR